MRIKLVLYSEKIIDLPLHYNQTVQGMLYKSLPKFLSDFLHDVGFFYQKRKFKLFTFSKIFSTKQKIENKRLLINPPITLYISSAINDVAKQWGSNFLKKDIIKLGKNNLFLEEIEIMSKPKIKEETIIKTLSPITVYRTKDNNGKKYTQYYKPNEKEFNELIKLNIKRKYEIITGKKLEDFPFSIFPVSEFKENIEKFKNVFIKGIEGKFKIKTDPEILRTIYDAGIGAKNSLGFGMIEVIGWIDKNFRGFKWKR